MKEQLRELSSVLRPLGYKGSGQNFRNAKGEYLFVVNFQRSSDGIHFYINIGGQPRFVPDEGNCPPNVKALKEYECIFRRRIGDRLERDQSGPKVSALCVELEREVINFENQVLKAEETITTNDEKDVIRLLPFGCSPPRAAFHLARICLNMKDPERAKNFVEYGLSIVSGDASILIYDLKRVFDGA
ncbi:hypothetical protein ANAEL_01827 [Anaerolineales bacterium]|nr:hypothetical protein ANAEL_01827 [Anaerolineales bacterium]